MDLISNNRLLRFIWIYIVVLGFLFIFIIPPFQKTDEISHYYKTISVATGKFFCEKSGQNLIPKSLYDLPSTMMASFVNEDNQHRFPKGAIIPAIKAKFDEHLVSENISCTLPFIFYLPSAIVLFFPIFFKFNPLLIFYLGRLGFYLFSVFLFYLSLKVIPKKFHFLLLSCLSLPMVIVQMSSYNKEVIHIGFGIFAFSLFFSLRNKFSLHNLLLLLVSLIFFILPRPQYLPFFLLIFLVLDNQIKLKVISLASLIVAGSIAVDLYFQKFILLSSNTLVLPQLIYLKMFPLKIIPVLFNSYTNHIEAYYKSLIGTFGSIHSYLDWYVYAFYGVLLFLNIYSYAKVKISFRFREVVFIAFILASTIFLTFFSMYLYATPVAFPYVVDVQGRYFIMTLPYLIIIFAKVINKFGIKLIYFGFILATTFLLKNVYDRYFDYSKAFYYDFSGHIDNEQTINGKIGRLISIDPNKKFLGLHFILNNNHPNQSDWSWLLTFYKKDCHTELKKVVVGRSIVNQSFRDTIFDVPLRDVPDICYTLEHLGRDKFEDGKSFFILGEGLPIYAF